MYVKYLIRIIAYNQKFTLNNIGTFSNMTPISSLNSFATVAEMSSMASIRRIISLQKSCIISQNVLLYIASGSTFCQTFFNKSN